LGRASEARFSKLLSSFALTGKVGPFRFGGICFQPLSAADLLSRRGPFPDDRAKELALESERELQEQDEQRLALEAALGLRLRYSFAIAASFSKESCVTLYNLSRSLFLHPLKLLRS